MTSSNLDLEDSRVCTSRTSMHSFKTTYGTEAMLPGFRYFFQIHLTKGYNFKIGVSRSRDRLEGAFSETEDGWSYYSGQGGQLRHASKVEGPAYGQAYSKDDVVGVYVDLVEVRH